MNDRMIPLPFCRLMDWVLSDPHSLFGVPCHSHTDPDQALHLFGGIAEAPFGPAAGPHTQLAQNIIAAYAAGARFFELKTVQTLDGEDLPVAKPCINARDEGYNVEWSTELTVEDALAEYIKAWFALKLLSRELSLGGPDGFVFNISVGYDLKGIRSAKIDHFIESMTDARSHPVFQACATWAKDNLQRFAHINAAYMDGISPKICASVTVSTLHGCPPEEIERIATYLVAEKGLHTLVKLNPTLLGYDFARSRLDAMGYDSLVFDNHHFENDLQYGDAVPMLRRLNDLAQSRGLDFGVKLTNTFPVKITAGELPGEEMYLSGRPLFALATALAAKLSRSFGGKLRISYSGGADAYNIAGLLGAGVRPVTLATTLLKPGGYQRLTQMARAGHAYEPSNRTDTEALEHLAEAAVKDPHYTKPVKPLPSRKNGRKVPLMDCATAPCQGGCPIGQDVPAYLALAGEGRYLEALRVIVEKNPLPSITGTLCGHRCQGRCRRNDYEETVRIRSVKKLAADQAMRALLAEVQPPPQTGPRVAVVGGGAAGLSAAYFLARTGLSCTLFEKRESLGGVVRHVIPPFRIAQVAIDSDIALVRAMGVDIRLDHEVTDLAALRGQGYRYIILAVGASKRGHLPLKAGEAVNAIDFLETFRRDARATGLGRHVAVVGAGNTAMDAARAAIRVPGVESVSIVYRRDIRAMPAEEAELRLAEADGVRFLPLLAPVRHEGGLLTCRVMRLGEPGPDGRRTPVATGETKQIPADTVLCAVGEQVDLTLYEALRIGADTFLAGDGRDGPATVVEAIADARAAVDAILRLEGVTLVGAAPEEAPQKPCATKGVLAAYEADEREPGRCLRCDAFCECCVDVCPNRANIAVTVQGRTQIAHIGRLCNACGNCETFCPYDSAPYKEKFTLFHTEADFEESGAPGMFVQNLRARQVRLRTGEEAMPLAAALLDHYPYLL